MPSLHACEGSLGMYEVAPTAHASHIVRRQERGISAASTSSKSRIVVVIGLAAIVVVTDARRMPRQSSACRVYWLAHVRPRERAIPRWCAEHGVREQAAGRQRPAGAVASARCWFGQHSSDACYLLGLRMQPRL
jgi:hypothetical protein